MLPFHQWGNWGLVTLADFPERFRNREGSSAQAFWLPTPLGCLSWSHFMLTASLGGWEGRVMIPVTFQWSLFITHMCANSIYADQTGKQDYKGSSKCHTSGWARSSKLLSCVQHRQKMDSCFLQHHLPQGPSHSLQWPSGLFEPPLSHHRGSVLPQTTVTSSLTPLFIPQSWARLPGFKSLLRTY